MSKNYMVQSAIKLTYLSNTSELWNMRTENLYINLSDRDTPMRTMSKNTP
jgi:hypothetical protein